MLACGFCDGMTGRSPVYVEMCIRDSVDTRRFKKLMDEEYPQIKVVKPTAGKTVVL